MIRQQGALVGVATSLAYNNPLLHVFQSTTVVVLNVHGSVHRKNILIYVQKDATLYTQFILCGNCSTCFGWYLHPSSGVQTTVSTASGICLTVTATCRYIAAGSSNSQTNTKCCRYSCLHSWWWVEVLSEICRAVSRWNKLCNVASCWIYIRIYWVSTLPHHLLL
jgi:hypothetical protein